MTRKAYQAFSKSFLENPKKVSDLCKRIKNYYIVKKVPITSTITYLNREAEIHFQNLALIIELKQSASSQETVGHFNGYAGGNLGLAERL